MKILHSIMSSAAKPPRRTSPRKPCKQTISKTSSETPSTDAHQSTTTPAVEGGNGAIKKNKAGENVNWILIGNVFYGW